MAWIESHTSLRHHPKIRRLSRKLSIPVPAAMGHLHCLWHWATEYAPDGDLTGFDVDEVADAAMFDGSEYDLDGLSAGDFVKALVDAGWVDEAPTTLVLHDWWEYAGQLLDSRRQAQEGGKLGNHKRWHADRGVVDPTCPFCRQDSPPTSPPESPPDDEENRPPNRPESHMTLQNKTEPNQDQERVSASFEEFWSAYPRHHSTGKPGGGASRASTVAKWKRLSDDDRQACLSAVHNYTEAMSRPGAPYPAAALTWLNQRRWEDWLTPAEYELARGPSPPRDRFAEAGRSLQQRVDLVREEGRNGQLGQKRDEARGSLSAG